MNLADVPIQYNVLIVMKKKKYDIFISYRRSSYDTANLVATRLKSAGYSVFFDMETLRSGKFNEQLYDVIENCTDFLLVLPPGALDRCVNEDDWVRLEVLHAMKNKKNIIPVMLNGFAWPDTMPEGLEELSDYQALTASSVEYFDMAMERLQNRYLLSRRHFMFHKFAKFVAVCVASLLVLTALLWCVFMYLSRDVCTNYATRIINDASAIHLLATDNVMFMKEWDEYEAAFNYGTSDTKIKIMRDELRGQIEVTEKNVRNSMALVDSVQLEIGAYHAFLLSMNGINSQEIAISPVYSTLMFTDYLNCLSAARSALDEPSALAMGNAKMQLEAFFYSLNAYYASTLSELSKFPESSLELYKEASKSWINFPTHYKFGEDEEYYIDIANKEMQKAEEALGVFSSELTKTEAAVDDFERDNNTSGALNDQMRQLDKQLTDFYNGMKADCEFGDADGQYQKWGKCYFLGNFIDLLITNQQMMYDDGFNFRFTLTPDAVYKDVELLFDKYEKEYPESKAYVASAKAFFKAVSKQECEYAGIMVFAFKDNLSHSVLKVGDIIFDYGGERIMSLSGLKSAYSKDNAKETKVYRLVNGKLKVVEVDQLVDTDIIGFLELVVDNDVPQE